MIEILQRQNPHLETEVLLSRIMCGEIYVNDEKVVNHKRYFSPDSKIIYRKSSAFVSRGGIKLDHVLDLWKVDVSEKVFIDIGSSTGGFTDCLLKRGAGFVYAVEVGNNILDYKLRTNPKVKTFEKTNVMNLKRSDFSSQPDAAVMDLSFRSIRGAVSHVFKLIRMGWMIALVKPQFEWGNPSEYFRGVIRDNSLISTILDNLAGALKDEGVYVKKKIPSPLKGRKGNTEYFFFLSDTPNE